MNTITYEYTIHERVLYESARSLIVIGERNEDKLPVVFKFLKNEYPTPLEIEALKKEFEITKMFDSPFIVHAYDFQRIQNKYAIILEYLDRKNIISLSETIKKVRFTVEEFLELAIKIAAGLKIIHQHNIIHSDINPSNILYNRHTKEVKIIDFGLSITLKKDWAPIFNPNVITGTLPYLSPEQTGRMNRGIDYRTDFYSLGITFYQLVTGRLPFLSEDPMELIHSHIAIMPQPPDEVEPSVPKIVSAIIMKLTAKNADERYSNINGLIADLENCLEQIRKTGEIHPFELGTQDVRDHFQIPEKLYGRERELDLLLKTFDEVALGETKLLLISGYSGIGKSALVHEIQKPIINKKGYFISGKFDQYKKNIPYSGLIKAFNDFIEQLLTESEAKIQNFRIRILEAIGENGQLLTTLIPQFALIIGEQAPVADLGPTESFNRLSTVFQNLITVLASEEHPLSLFLDDLQWADLSSLKLLETLLSSHCHYLLIMGAYRSNEVNESHPLMRTIENLKKSQIVCESIYLKPLELASIEELLADTLHHDRPSVMPLAKICYEKTEGNPFFLIQILETLYKEHLIEFNKETNKWDWHLDQIINKKVSDNVVDLLLEKIRKLPPSSQKVLELAACIGNKFNLDVLAEIAKKSLEEVLVDLQEIMKEGFVLKKGVVNTIPAYQFVHDRVEQAAHSLVKEEEERFVHLDIGRILLRTTPEEKIKDHIFDIVNHFNAVLDPTIPEEIPLSERKQIADLNLRAAKMAKSAAAFEAGLKYAEACLKCQEKEAWKSNYSVLFDAYSEATENASLSSKFDLMEKYAGIALKHSKNLLDEVRIVNIKIRYFNTQNNYEGSINLVIKMLNKLGVKLNPDPSKFEVLFAIIKVKFQLLGRKIPDLYDLPPVNDPLKEAIQGLLSCIFVTTLLINDPNLTALIICKSVSLSIQQGNSKYSPLAYSAYGMICCGALNDFQSGYQMGELAFKLMESLNPYGQRTSVNFFNHVFINHWKDPINNSIQKLLENYENGIHVGDREYSFYSLIVYFDFSVIAGKPLKKLLKDSETQRSIVEKHNISNVQLALRITEQWMKNLIEIQEDPSLLAGPAFDEQTTDLSKLSDKDISQVSFRIYFIKLALACTFGKTEGIIPLINQCELYVHTVTSTFVASTYNFYKSILLLAIYPTSSSKEKTYIRKAVKKNQKILKKWIDFSPYNNKGKYLLVEAEWSSKVLGETNKAIHLYNEAIAFASQNGFLPDEALTSEKLAELYLLLGSEKIAKIYLKDARQAYLVWGADAKVAQLDTKYTRLLESQDMDTHLISSSSSGKTNSATLDIVTIQKCSQTISSTIVLTDLLKNMMRIVIENAGAEKGFFLLNKNGKYVIEAEGNVSQLEATVLQSLEATEARLPLSIINFVIHTKETVVLDDATEANKFVKDPYIVSHQPRSILCMPLLNQGALSGVLYLENNLAPKAFTKDRIELLKLLSSQIAISVDNARLYENTVDLNKHLVSLNTSYERFVPKDFLSLLNKNSIMEVALGDHMEGKMSVLFTDIREFTSRSEKMSPEENFIFINSFLNLIAPIIRKHHGFIDKYIGDAIMALFPESADDAISCALEMQRVLIDYNESHKEQEPVRIGIGINTGLLMLGTVGEELRLGATVISDAVNIASRVESLTKTYNESILITESTYKNLQSSHLYLIEPVGETLVKGKSIKLTLYKVKPVI